MLGVINIEWLCLHPIWLYYLCNRLFQYMTFFPFYCQSNTLQMLSILSKQNQAIQCFNSLGVQICSQESFNGQTGILYQRATSLTISTLCKPSVISDNLIKHPSQTYKFHYLIKIYKIISTYSTLQTHARYFGLPK